MISVAVDCYGGLSYHHNKNGNIGKYRNDYHTDMAFFNWLQSNKGRTDGAYSILLIAIDHSNI